MRYLRQIERISVEVSKHSHRKPWSEDASAPIGENERAHLLELTIQLEQPELNLNARLNIAGKMREALGCSIAYSLPVPVSMEAELV